MWFISVFLCLLFTTASPIKKAREELSDNFGWTQQDYLVTKLPGLTENIPEAEIPLMFAGQLPLYKENNTHYFFWKFVDRQKEARAENKTIFWLNGGPGCSSMDGALMEAGPFRINKNKQVTGNPGSWHRKGDIVFVDQPAGTGFSYSKEFVTELGDVAWHFLTFLDRYFKLFPEDLNNEILLAGESYAGQYIPYIADAILSRNARIVESVEKKGKREENQIEGNELEGNKIEGNEKENNEEHLVYNLTGLLIGNGFISPNEQGLSIMPFAIKHELIKTSHPRWNDLLKTHEQCQKAVDNTIKSEGGREFEIVERTCDRVLTDLLHYTVDQSASSDKQCLNMYDYTLKDAFPSCGMNWPPDLENVNPFLRKEAVMADLNLVSHKKWTECSESVGSHFRQKSSRPSIELFPRLLEKVNIVLFHGDRDIICNYMGAELMIKNLKWGGQQGFSEDAITYDWHHNGTVQGLLTSERNLTYVNIFNSSHMVPFDKPEVSRAIVDLLYRDYDVRTEGKPEIETRPVGNLAGNGTGIMNETPSAGNSTSNSGNDSEKQSHTKRVVRVIQLAVIVVLIWGICALYSTYKSKPVSIIKTNTRSTGKRKNVSWADELESVVKAPGLTKTPSLISKAFSKFTRADSSSAYQTVDPEEIEMDEHIADDFIIGSDDDIEGSPSEREDENSTTK